MDTANSRNILVRMIGSVVAHYRAEEERRAEEQAAFKASLASSSLSSSAGEADCAICLGPVDGPLQLRCGHTFCAGCIELWRATAEGAPSCPSCREPLPPSASEKLDRAAAFLAMRTRQPAKASPAKTARSGAKKAARAMALVAEAHAINPMARASVAGGYGGATPMCMAAATDGGDATVRALAAREAEGEAEGEAATSTVNVPDGAGATPLHLSVVAGCRVNVKALIALGADLGATNSDGHTSLELAIALGNNAIKAELEGAGATITKKAYAAAVRRRRTALRVLRRPVWDLFGCYYARPAAPSALPPAAARP